MSNATVHSGKTRQSIIKQLGIWANKCIHREAADDDEQNSWLLLETDAADLCLEKPTQERDLYVRSNLETFTKGRLGDVGLRKAFRENTITVRSRPDLGKQFPA